MLTIVSDRWTDLLHDRHWWRRAWAASWRFAPHCIPCAALLTAANVIVAIGGDYAISRMKQPQAAVITDLGPILILYLSILIGLMVILVLSMVALAQWLLKLTMFARLFCEAEQAHENAGGDAAPSAYHLDSDAVANADQAIRKRWVYVMKVWLVASLLLLPPAVPLMVLVMLHSMIAGPMPLDIKVLGWPSWLTSPSVAFSAFAVGAVLTVICTAYSFVTIVFSAVSEMPAPRTAVVAMKESIKHWLPLCIITAIILLANIVITAPQMIAYLTPLAAFAKQSVVEACAQVWLGISSLVLWPLSVAPFCRITREIPEAGNG
jgi:hypothetical protein